jgi:hypothetical protein
MGVSGQRWAVEQVFALARRPSIIAGATAAAVPVLWTSLGCDDRAVWGRYRGSSAEPYDVVADHVEVATRCTCPSRVAPCKHALALLLLWARGQVPQSAIGGSAAAWIDSRRSAAVATPTPAPSPAPSTADAPTPPDPPEPSSRDDRVARMAAGLAELDRWLDDRLRTGLTDPALARYSTWDDLAARLVDAQAGGLANRVRRLAGAVGSAPEWHRHVLAEMGVLHLIARAGGRLRELPPGLGDSVAMAAGWQVRQADVLAGVPETDTWLVLGRSDTREDRIEVRRMWIRGERRGRWAMLLSFAAYRQSLDDSVEVGTRFPADLYRYPGTHALRAILGLRHGAPEPAVHPPGASLTEACAAVGSVVADEPWIEHLAFTVSAAPARLGGRWVLADRSGSLPMVASPAELATLLACSGGTPVVITCEWTPSGVRPLTVHLPDRTVDIGPRADPSFVSGGWSVAS